MNIIVVAGPDRPDHYNYFVENTEHTYFFLWHEKASLAKIKKEKIPPDIKLIYWLDFATPKQIINTIKPDKIVFLEIFDLRQIALIIYAGYVNVDTFYLDHGLADVNVSLSYFKNTEYNKLIKDIRIKRFKSTFTEVLKAKLFYFSVTSGFHSFNSYSKFLKLPFLMLFKSGKEVLSTIFFKERIPKYSLIFNQVNFADYSLYTGVKKDEVVFTGVPFFDEFYQINSISENYFVYIDHPYLEVNVNGWNSEFHEMIANKLFLFAKKNKRKLFVKLHPSSNIELWKSYQFDEQYITIIQQGDYTDLYLKSELIFGFSSTLLVGFLCAKKNVVLLGWHPEPDIFGFDFSKTGLCHVSYSHNDLDDKLNFWLNNNLANKEPEYTNFIKNYNFPFDGKATERIIKLITNV